MIRLAVAVLVASTGIAHAAESDYCETYAQERVNSLRMTDPRYAEITNQLADYVVLRLWAICLNADEWPPKGDATVAPTKTPNSEHVKTCKAHFRSYDPETDTVIPYHHKDRVKCPL